MVIKEVELAVIPLGQSGKAVFHQGLERPPCNIQVAKLLILDSSTCIDGTFNPLRPEAISCEIYSVVASGLVEVLLRKNGNVKEQVLSVLLEELKCASDEMGIERVAVEAGDQVQASAIVFTKASDHDSGTVFVDFSSRFDADWKLWSASRNNLKVLARHELSHIKAADQAVVALPQSLGLPEYFIDLVATPFCEAGAHLLCPRDLVERYIQLTVESSCAEATRLNRNSLKELVDAVTVIACVAGTVEWFRFDKALVRRLEEAAKLDQYAMHAVDLSKALQLEFYRQRSMGIRNVDLRNESLRVFAYWKQATEDMRLAANELNTWQSPI